MTDNQKDINTKNDYMGQGVDLAFLRYVSLKAQKMAQALYMVTSFVSDSEPLKWRLRESVIDLISDTELLLPTMATSAWAKEGQISPLFKVSVLEVVLNKAKQITVLIDVSLAGNFASEMNLHILHREFHNLIKDIENRLGEGILNSMLTEILPERIPDIGHNEYIKDKYLDMRQTKAGGLLSKKDEGLGANGQNFLNKGQDLKKTPINNELRNLSKNSRRGEILNFLKGKSWTSIKDISEAIGSCSTKTIQRELADLVKIGVLKKKGDRRWSRYLLN